MPSNACLSSRVAAGGRLLFWTDRRCRPESELLVSSASRQTKPSIKTRRCFRRHCKLQLRALPRSPPPLTLLVPPCSRIETVRMLLIFAPIKMHAQAFRWTTLLLLVLNSCPQFRIDTDKQNDNLSDAAVYRNAFLFSFVWWAGIIFFYLKVQYSSRNDSARRECP